MELEKRVQMLEQELQVLKNQIQATLLDMREQLLNNTYPALHSEALPIPESAVSPVRTVAVTASQPGLESKIEAVPTGIQKVSLDQIGAVSMPALMANQSEEWGTMEELEEWATNKLEKLGLRRTQQLVRMYGEKGRFSAEIMHDLLQIISLYDDVDFIATEQMMAAPTRQPVAQRAPQKGQPSPKAARQARLTAASQPRATNSKAAAKNTYPSAQIVQSHIVQPEPVAVQAQAAVVTAQKPTKKRAQKETVVEDEGSQSIILRLIAGVQNAGAGIKWSNRNG